MVSSIRMRKNSLWFGMAMLIAALASACEGGTSPSRLGSSKQRLENGDFAGGTNGWWATENIATSLSAETGALCATVPGGLANPWDAIIGQGNQHLEAGQTYRFSFRASASGDATISAMIQEPGSPWGTFVLQVASLNGEMQDFEQVFTMGTTDQVPQVAFQIGGAADEVTFCFDDVALEPAQPQEPGDRENLVNGNFSAELSAWWTDSFLTDWDVSSGAFCATVPSTGQPWEGLLGQNALRIEAGVPYTLSFFAAGDSEPVRAVVQDPSDYAQLGFLWVMPTAAGEVYSAVFTSTRTVENAQFMFQLGGASAPWQICIDEVSLKGGAGLPTYEPETGPRVRVNQTGYLRNGPKQATLVSDAVEPLPFVLVDAAGTAVLTGETAPFGLDVSSGLKVHIIDFSAFNKDGAGYTVTADGEASYPFAVGDGAYDALRDDALGFFYPMRSGIEINDAIAGAGYGRPAGHVGSPTDDNVNPGDVDVPCQSAEDSARCYGEPWTCDYTLDVTGGWYDAGDPGKYVVNGGITVFQMLNLFERAKLAPTGNGAVLTDGTLRIPETDNGIPDVLDEVRWELDFFLKMMVPNGDPQAGMVHHKVHGNEWTGLPMPPHADPTVRWLHRPSTAATLNLAAAAAQAARIFAPYDAAYAKTLLGAARTAWAAALAHPDLFAPEADGDDGGGAYADNNVDDEFYWAATELYLTTGEKVFRNFILSSPMHSAEVFPKAGLIWNNVAGFARIELASVPNDLQNKEAIKRTVIEGAEGYLADQAMNGFGQPYDPPEGVYPWGSNSQVLSNLYVLGAAYDLTGDARYRDAVVRGMDYILGRNALNISYVTGYGTIYSENMHSRWFAHSLDEFLPRPPVGTISGGPNTIQQTWDPLANRLFGTTGCTGQFCYVDDIESYATNEPAINWNAGLAWVAGFIADQETGNVEPYGECRVSYDVLWQCPRSGRFLATLTVENTGSKTLKDWSLAWSYLGDQKVTWVPGADTAQDAAKVTLSPKGKRPLKPKKTVTYILTGEAGTLASTSPGTFFLNGAACRMQ